MRFHGFGENCVYIYIYILGKPNKLKKNITKQNISETMAGKPELSLWSQLFGFPCFVVLFFGLCFGFPYVLFSMVLVKFANKKTHNYHYKST